MSKEVDFIVLGEPIPKGRPRMNRKTGGVFTPRETLAYEELVGWGAKSTGVHFGSSWLACGVDFRCARKGKHRADLDNLLKAVLDGCQAAGLFEDDIQVIEVHARRWDGCDEPRAEVRFRELALQIPDGS